MTKNRIKKVEKSKRVDDCLDPIYNFESLFDLEIEGGSQLWVDVMDYDYISDDRIG